MSVFSFLFSNKYYPHLSLLIARVSTGFLMFYLHGWSKLLAGPNRWERLGTAVTNFIGLDFLSIPLGFMASFSESIAALLLIIGLYTRPAAFLLALTMLIAVSKKLPAGLKGAELPLLFFTLSLVLVLCGAGKFSLDNYISNNSKDA